MRFDGKKNKENESQVLGEFDFPHLRTDSSTNAIIQMRVLRVCSLISQ
jgi:hypothetical protein